MQLFQPDYFEKFHCIAAACPDSCCKEWDVLVDEESAALYRSLEGSLGDHLRQVLQKDEVGNTVMTIQDGRCPMWQQDGLCRIQSQLGESALCQVCRDFPRLTHDYGSFIERGLELSCPEAARLILTAANHNFLCQEVPDGQAPEYDTEVMEILLRTRKMALELLYDDHFSPAQALTLLLYYGYQAQARVDGDEPPAFSAEMVLDAAKNISAQPDTQAFVHFFTTLEVLTPQWSARLSQPLSPACWTLAFRNLAVYFVQRYWLQAVSDYDLVSRVKLVVTSCLLVRLMGGDLLQTAQLYSKEIENNIDNLDALLDAMYTVRAFTDINLLSLLAIAE